MLIPGKSYEQMSNFTGIPVQLLQIEHIRKSRESKDYEEQIQFYAVRLIKKHGTQILLIDNINRLTRFIPFRFRSAVKHLIHNLKKQEREIKCTFMNYLLTV